MSDLDWSSASAIAEAVSSRKVTALDAVNGVLTRIEKHNPVLNAFTVVLADRARAKAAKVDSAIARGEKLGPLAGVPFAVKNLLDVEGLPTRAGSKINRTRAAATQDAPLIERLEAAGAILVGALNM